MTKFIKLEDGSDVNAAAIRRIHVEKHIDPRFCKLSAQPSRPEGGAEWADHSGEFGSLKDAEEATRELGR